VCNGDPHHPCTYLTNWGLVGARMFLDIMNTVCCFYLRERIKHHPNYTYSETKEFCTIEYSLKSPIYILKWDYQTGLILELDRNKNIVWIGTPIRIENLENLNQNRKGFPAYLDGKHHGFFRLDWKSAT